MKKNMKITITITLLVLFITIFFISITSLTKKEDSIKNEVANKEIKEEKIPINEYYNQYVITNTKSIIYKKERTNFVQIGEIESGIELTLGNIDNEYFEITNLDDKYYIKYNNVSKIEKLTEKDNRFENYIVWNKNIITKDNTTFYDENGKSIYSFKKSMSLPIIIDDSVNNKYFVEYDNKLLYVLEDEIKEIKNTNNTESTNTEGIPILNYHFIYTEAEKEECNQDICMSESQLEEHLKYIKDNNYFTPTMKELEMYMDKKIQLPKSVVLTADDGWLSGNFEKKLDEYQLNGTIFLITGSYDPKYYKSKYIEVHSHGDHLHDVGVCPGGQGGAIKCLNHDALLKDLQTSREKLNNSTIFCYPFYEYNSYSINTLKEAGFTMAFAGEYAGGEIVARPGGNKYEIPRWVMVNYTTLDDIKTYLNLGIA